MNTKVTADWHISLFQSSTIYRNTHKRTYKDDDSEKKMVRRNDHTFFLKCNRMNILLEKSCKKQFIVSQFYSYSSKGLGDILFADGTDHVKV